MKRTEARELAFKTIYSRFFNTETEEENVPNKDLEFVNAIVSNYLNNKEEITNLISTHLKGYTINRVYKVDLAILIVAIVELNYIKENPKEVVINEAIEISKKYSTEKSPRFINGVLADIFNK